MEVGVGRNKRQCNNWIAPCSLPGYGSVRGKEWVTAGVGRKLEQKGKQPGYGNVVSTAGLCWGASNGPPLQNGKQEGIFSWNQKNGYIDCTSHAGYVVLNAMWAGGWRWRSSWGAGWMLTEKVEEVGLDFGQSLSWQGWNWHFYFQDGLKLHFSLVVLTLFIVKSLNTSK